MFKYLSMIVLGAALLCAGSFAGGASAEAGWHPCAREGVLCRVPFPTRVRFGAHGSYVVQPVSIAIPCTNAAFGSDPAYGVRKGCAFAAPGGWPGAWYAPRPWVYGYVERERIWPAWRRSVIVRERSWRGHHWHPPRIVRRFVGHPHFHAARFHPNRAHYNRPHQGRPHHGHRHPGHHHRR